MHKYKCNIMCTFDGVGGSINKACGASVTIYGKSTSNFFKHVRCFARRGCAAHEALMEELGRRGHEAVARATGVIGAT